MWVYLNGQFLQEEEAKISFLDRGFVFADAVYEVVHIYHGRFFFLDRHLQRLQRSLAEIKLEFDVETLRPVLLELLKRHQGMDEGSLYLQISRGAAPRKHGLSRGIAPTVVAYITELSDPDRTLWEQGGRAIFYQDIRWHLCHVKTVGLLVNCLAKEEALSQGAQDAIFLRNGIVTEATSSNVFMVKKGILYTHPNGHWILPGITRQLVLELARDLGIPAKEQPFSKEELLAAEEVFLTGTMGEIAPYVVVEGQKIGSGEVGPVTRHLQHAFRQLTQRV